MSLHLARPLEYRFHINCEQRWVIEHVHLGDQALAASVNGDALLRRVRDEDRVRDRRLAGEPSFRSSSAPIVEFYRWLFSVCARRRERRKTA